MEKVLSFLANPALMSQGIEALRLIAPQSKNLDFYLSKPDAKPGSLHFNLMLDQLKNAYRIFLATNPRAPDVTSEAKPIEAKPLRVKKNTIYNSDFVDLNSLPKNIQKLYIQNQQLTRDLAGLHQELKLATSNKKRLPLAKSIKELTQARAANWKEIDKYIDSKRITDNK